LSQNLSGHPKGLRVIGSFNCPLKYQNKTLLLLLNAGEKGLLLDALSPIPFDVPKRPTADRPTHKPQ
jgi:hypothetical protein